MTESPHLLPKNVKPLRYDLWFRPDLESFKFVGQVIITLDVLDYTNTLVLHSADLMFDRVFLRFGLNSYIPDTIIFDKDKKTVTLRFGEKSEESLHPASGYKLEIWFAGEINDQLCGWYRSDYELPNGEKRYMAVTQCEAIDARRMFPCWDEPDQKAEFYVAVEIPENLTAISNMPEQEVFSTVSGWKLVKFLPTPPMSTYLFALMVGEFEWVEKRTIEQALENIRVNAKWLKRDREIIKNWFEDKKSATHLSEYADEGGEA